MSDFKAMKFVRETRDKIYEETKNKTNEEVRNYYKEKASWIYSSLRENDSKNLKTKSHP